MAEPNPALESADVVSLGDEKQAIEVVAQSILGLWEVVSNLTRLRPTRRERYRVTIFGSARTMPGHLVYEEVRRLAAELARMGCDIVTGGGPGLMQAANEGAVAGGDPDRSRSVGIRVHRPFEQEVNAFVGQAYEHRTFFSRLPPSSPAPSSPAVHYSVNAGKDGISYCRRIRKPLYSTPSRISGTTP